MIAGINELKTLTKRMSCECKCKFDGRQYNSNQKWIDDKCRSKYKTKKKHCVCKKKKIIFGILLHVVAKIVNI